VDPDGYCPKKNANPNGAVRTRPIGAVGSGGATHDLHQPHAIFLSAWSPIPPTAEPFVRIVM